MSEHSEQMVAAIEHALAHVAALATGEADKFGLVRDTLTQVAVDLPHEHVNVAAMLNLAVSAAGKASDATTGPAAAAAVVAALEAAIQVLKAPGAHHAPAIAQATEALAALALLDFASVGYTVSETFDLVPADADDELLSEFIADSREFAQKGEAALLRLEENKDDDDAVNTVFRAFHTIKGSAGMVGITPIAVLAHGAEGLLSRVRDGEIRFSGGYADLAFKASDMLNVLLDRLENAMAGDPVVKPDTYDELVASLQAPEEWGYCEDREIVPVDSASSVAPSVTEAPAVEAPVAAPAKAIASAPAAKPAPTAKAPVAPAAKANQGRQAGSGDSGDNGGDFVRVRTERLDSLMDAVAELVVAHSMLSQDEDVMGSRRQQLTRKVGQIGKLVREVQETSLSLRMVPLQGTFQKMQRLVRDLSRKSGKPVTFTTDLPDGEDTELDRSIADAIAEPLVHMLRNSIDHGIEPPADRAAAGKPAQGHIRLAAHSSEGNLVVTVSDDGRGLDREKIARKAVERGLIESDANMTDADVFGLIFAPGFSTAEKVTDISGRGVGMDIVRRTIEELGGRLNVRSELGKGCTIELHLPFTLAVMDSMLVKVGEQRYIMPTLSIHTSFVPTPEAVVTVAGRGEIVFLRDRPLPLLRLHRLYGVEDAKTDPTEALVLVVSDSKGRETALLVDGLLGQQHLVVKSLNTMLGDVPGVSGTAILGNGRVALVIDPTSIIRWAQQHREASAA